MTQSKVAEYRKAEGYSYSTLKAYLKSPLHGLTQEPPTETAAMRFGSAVDCALKKDKSWVVNPHDDGRTKAAKEFKEEHKGRLVLSKAEADKVMACVAAVESNKLARSLCLDLLYPDMPLFGEYEGVRIKGLPDWSFGNSIYDLKTTSGSIEMSGFARTVDSYHYDLQAAVYTELLQQNGEKDVVFYWIALESDPPFDLTVYKCTPEILFVGYTKLKIAIENVKKAENNKKEGICNIVRELIMPPWYGKNIEG